MTTNHIRFPCPKCGWVLSSPPGLVGRRAKCKNCGTEVRVPDAAPPEPLSLDDAPAAPAGARWLLPAAGGALVLALIAGVGGFVAGRSEVGPLRGRVADAEQQAKEAKASFADQVDRLAAAEQRARDRGAAADDLRQAKDAAEAKLARAAKDQKDATAAADKLKTDLDAATTRVSALEGAARSGATAKDAAAGDVRAAKDAQLAAERQVTGLKAEVARLRRDLDEAEKFGPFQAFAGRWQSREKVGDIAVVSISIKGSGSCWAGTATPAGGGVANFQFRGVRLVAKDGKHVLDDQLMGRSWELARGPTADTLTMTAVGGGAAFALVREAEPAKGK